ncbi:hypothetical protein ACHAXA_011001 [Cyclostephanos tholiformis]|uniref:Uncharacterized protein n=1 Tax=Cyclostephanos tholiformis TaxID=382380 RepID=A0ABD3R9J0_9STRA
MASLLQTTDPWIKSTSLYALSFDPETFQEHHRDDRVDRHEGGGRVGEDLDEEE